VKLQALLLSAALSAAQAAPSLESVKGSSLRLPQLPELKFQQAAPAEPFFLDPKAAPLTGGSLAGEVLGKVRLAEQLDRHRSLAHLKLGARAWDVSVAGDAGFSRYYLTLRDGADLRLAPLGDLNRLRGEGVDIQVEKGVVYNFHLSINIFNPVRGSTFEIRPARGTGGQSYALKTGALLDAVRDRSFVFSAGGAEYWTLYGTDVDAATGGLAATRSFLFVHLDGLKSNAWPLAEASLPVGQPRRVTFRSDLVLARSADELSVARP
jgi:hypothetical protein